MPVLPESARRSGKEHSLLSVTDACLIDLTSGTADVNGYFTHRRPSHRRPFLTQSAAGHGVRALMRVGVRHLPGGRWQALLSSSLVSRFGVALP
jgi:hypothetical protein